MITQIYTVAVEWDPDRGWHEEEVVFTPDNILVYSFWYQKDSISGYWYGVPNSIREYER